MIRILYVCSTLERSGPTNQLFNLIKYLDRDSFDPQIITLSPEPADSRKADFENIGCPVRSLGLTRLQGLLHARRLLQKAIAELAPDIIHTQGLRADVLSSRLNTTIPRICTIHNFPQVDYPMTYGRFLGKLMVQHHTRAMLKLDTCVGVSSAVKDNLVENWSIPNCTSVQNGVDSEKFSLPPSGEDRLSIRQKLGFTASDTIVVSVGWLSSRKDPLTIIRAFQDISSPDLRLVFIGNGSLEKECRRASVNDKRILFTGRIPNVVDYLQAADLFVSASTAEGLPYSVLEAMACGLTPLLSDIGPHIELLPPDLHSSCIFPVGSSDELAEKMALLLGSDLTALSKLTYAHWTKLFSAHVMARGYEQVYETLCS